MEITRRNDKHFFLLNYRWICIASCRLKEANEFSSKEIFELTELQKALNPVKILVKHLSAKNVNIVAADKAINHTIDVLFKLDSPLSIKLATHIQIRYDERRNDELIFLMKSLLNPRMLVNKGEDATKNVIWKLENIYNRIYLENTFSECNLAKRSIEAKNDNNLNSHTYEFDSQRFSDSLKNVMLGITSSSSEKKG